MKDIVIIGARIDGHAGVVVSAVLALGKYRLAGKHINLPRETLLGVFRALLKLSVQKNKIFAILGTLFGEFEPYREKCPHSHRR